MGACSAKESSQKKKRENPSAPYQLPTTEALHTNGDQKSGTLHTYPRVLKDSLLLPLSPSLFPSNSMLRMQFRNTPNIGPVLSKGKLKWNRLFGFEPNKVRVKAPTFAESETNNEEIQHFMKWMSDEIKVHRWRSPKLFKLELAGCNKLSNRNIEVIGTELGKSFPRLENLQVNFAECFLLTDKSIGVFVHTICLKLRKLRKLELNFNRCCEISDIGMKKIGAEISKFLPKVVQLTLSFNECRKVTETGLKVFRTKIPRHLSNLKQYNLSFNSCSGVADQNFKVVAQRFANLKEFNLNLHRNTNFKDNGLGSLSLQMNHSMPKLKKFSLGLQSCFDITDAGLDSFQVNAKNTFNYLQHFTLELGECIEISDTGVEKFGNWIRNSLKQLTYLTLEFSNCLEFKGKGLETLGESLGALPQLKHLTLRLGGNENFLDKNLKAMGSNIVQGSPKIENLSIYFGNCLKITDKGFEAIVIEIRKLRTIRILALNFPGCEKITDRSLKIVETGVGGHLTNLEHLTTDFRGCKKVNYSIKELLRQSWIHAAKLEVF